MSKADGPIKTVRFPIRSKATVLSEPGAAVHVKRIDLPKSMLRGLTAHHVGSSSLPSFSDSGTSAGIAKYH